MAERSTAASKQRSQQLDRGGVRTPPVRPGSYDPADHAAYVVRSAEEAAVSPLLVMTVLHNEAYKPQNGPRTATSPPGNENGRYDLSFQPELDPRKVKDLASLSFVDGKTNAAMKGFRSVAGAQRCVAGVAATA
jgi:hypothetical protein